jgi:hypothetical protein
MQTGCQGGDFVEGWWRRGEVGARSSERVKITETRRTPGPNRAAIRSELSSGESRRGGANPRGRNMQWRVVPRCRSEPPQRCAGVDAAESETAEGKKSSREEGRSGDLASAESSRRPARSRHPEGDARGQEVDGRSELARCSPKRHRKTSRTPTCACRLAPERRQPVALVRRSRRERLKTKQVATKPCNVRLHCGGVPVEADLLGFERVYLEVQANFMRVDTHRINLPRSESL